MQHISFKKNIALIILFGLLTSVTAPSLYAMQSTEVAPTGSFFSTLDVKKSITLAALLLFVSAVVHYKIKKTTPKPLTAQNDSWSEALRVFWYNYIVGQKGKDERPAALIPDENNPGQLNFKYEKIEPFGLIGMAETYGPNILMALTVITTLIAKKNEIHKGINDFIAFVHNPSIIIAKPSPSSN